MTVDTLRYAEELQNAGVSQQQAKVHAQALSRAVQDGVATKADVAELRADLKTDIAALRGDIVGVRTEIGQLYWRVFYLLAAQAVAIVGLVAAVLQALK